MKEGDIVEVKWVDSAWSGGWRKPDEMPRPSAVLSVGYLRRKGKKKVCLAQGRAPYSDEWLNHISIPRDCIRSMKTVRRGKR
jgi:hypothetical protein